MNYISIKLLKILNIYSATIMNVNIAWMKRQKNSNEDGVSKET